MGLDNNITTLATKPEADLNSPLPLGCNDYREKGPDSFYHIGHFTIAEAARAHIHSDVPCSIDRVIDPVVEDICCAIAQRLPRKIEAYPFLSSCLSVDLEVPDLGNLQITLMTAANGVFTHITSIKGPDFEIDNSRPNGLRYKKLFFGLGKPYKVTVDPLELAIIPAMEIGDHNEALIKGIRYSSDPSKSILGSASNQSMHVRRDTLERPKNPTLIKVMQKHYLVDEYQKTYIANSNNLERFIKNSEQRQSFFSELNLKQSYNWEDLRAETAEWLKKNVLMNINKLPVPEQITSLPTPIPWPENIGTLKCLISNDDLDQIKKIQEKQEQVLIENLIAIQPRVGIFEQEDGMDIQKVATDPSIEVLISTDFTNPSKYSSCVEVEILPNRSNDVYILDMGPFENYRQELIESGVKNLTYEQKKKLIHLKTDTMMPIHEYQGSYSQPVVQFLRGIEHDEIVFPAKNNA